MPYPLGAVTDVEVPRDPRLPLDPLITGADVAAAEVLRLARRVASQLERGAPAPLRHPVQAALEAAVQELQELQELQEAAEADGVRWHPVSELAPYYPSDEATPRTGARGEPVRNDLYHELTDHLDVSVPVDCCFLPDSYLVQFPRTSLVLSPTGEVRDTFTTNGLRAVGGDRRHLLLVPGGGGAFLRGFVPAGYVRDLEQQRWLTGALPAAVPRCVSGTLPEVDAAVVVDLAEGAFYWTTPRLPDPAEYRTTSACGRYVWDGGSFVREAATGRAVLDARWIEGSTEGFARTGQGWRILLRQEPDEDDDRCYRFESDHPLRLLDETGEVVRDLSEDPRPPDVLALSPDGTRLLHATAEELRVVDADSGRLLEVVADVRALGVRAGRAEPGPAGRTPAT